MNGRGEIPCADRVVIRFNAVGTFAWGAVEVNRDEDRVALCVADGAACTQAHKVVAVACHHRSESIICEDLLQPLRDIESIWLLRNSLPRSSSAIVSSVTSVDDDCTHRGRRDDKRKENSGQDERSGNAMHNGPPERVSFLIIDWRAQIVRRELEKILRA